MPLKYPIKRIALGTIHGAIFETCRQYPDKTALTHCRHPESTYTYRELLELSAGIAAEIKRRGVAAGERIGLLCENRPEWGIVYLGILSAGAVVVPLDILFKPKELAGLIRLSGIRYLFCSDELSEQTRELCSDENLGVEILSVPRGNLREYYDIDGDEGYICRETSPDDAAVLIYTSGTTGDSKGVILTHRNIVSNLEGVTQILPLEEDDNFLSILPLYHTFEATCGLLLPLLMGLTVSYARSLKSREIIEDIKARKATYLVGVPLLYEKMYKTICRRISELPSYKRAYLKAAFLITKSGWPFGLRAGRYLFKNLRAKTGLDSVRYFVCGGAPLPAEIAAWFNLVGFNFLEGYGLTECAPVVSVNLYGDIRFGSVGPPLPNIEAAIDSPSPDGIGEIIVRGQNNTPGYVDNPVATAELIKNGWLYTGDLGRIEGNHIYIMGRRKSMIVTAAGKNVYPEEIEDFLLLSPYIMETVVAGRKRENRMGEDICVIIFPDLVRLQNEGIIAAGELSADKIMPVIESEVKEINRHLADYKRISKIELRFEEFEKTSTKKIKRVLYK